MEDVWGGRVSAVARDWEAAKRNGMYGRVWSFSSEGERLSRVEDRDSKFQAGGLPQRL